jgi:hypothetical protein
MKLAFVPKVWIGLIVLILCGCQKGGGATQDVDRSFYREVDTKAWPGDAMSERQVLDAYAHFKDPGVCRKPWSWALIGPNTFLLKGTVYLVHRAIDAPAPNIHWSKGYWGSGGIEDMSFGVDSMRRRVENLASNDCKYNPGSLQVDKSGPDYGAPNDAR